jgi:hypothetical protein
MSLEINREATKTAKGFYKGFFSVRLPPFFAKHPAGWGLRLRG